MKGVFTGLKQMFKKGVDLVSNNVFTRSMLGKGGLKSLNKNKGFIGKHNNNTNIKPGTSRMNNLFDAPHNMASAVGNTSMFNTNVKKLVNTSVNSPTSLMTQAAVGATAMTALSMMSGAVGRAQDIMSARYLQDSRYSSRMMTQTSIGKAMGKSKMSIGNHTGLSLSMHKTRHG